MMPTSPRSPLSFRTASFPQYGWKDSSILPDCGARPVMGVPTAIEVGHRRDEPPEIGFALDSSLEGTGFEPSVPLLPLRSAHRLPVVLSPAAHSESRDVLRATSGPICYRALTMAWKPNDP